MTDVYHRIVQESFIPFPLSDPANLSEYSRFTDNYERDGKLFLGGGWGQAEVWESTADLVWVRKLTEGTAPEERHFSSEWELVTAADWEKQFSPAPNLKRGDRVVLKTSPYITGTVACRSSQAEYLRGEESWYVEWNDGWDMFARSYSPDQLIKFGGEVKLTVVEPEGVVQEVLDLFESLRSRTENPPSGSSKDSISDWDMIRRNGWGVRGEVVDNRLELTVKRVR